MFAFIVFRYRVMLKCQIISQILYSNERESQKNVIRMTRNYCQENFDVMLVRSPLPKKSNMV